MLGGEGGTISNLDKDDWFEKAHIFLYLMMIVKDFRLMIIKGKRGGSPDLFVFFVYSRIGLVHIMC